MEIRTKKLERSGLEIAVIGMDARFPGATNYSKFWENLQSGKESLEFIDEKELNDMIEKGQVIADNFVNCKGGVLSDKDLFDADFFQYTPKSAEILDPQIRIFHESVWKALEDAACVPSTFPGRIGLFAGASPSTYWEFLTQVSGKLAEIGDFDGGQLNTKDSISTLVSYKLGLTGPSYMVHTNCSTSLVAVHLACRSLLMGECEIAIAGGVGMMYRPQLGYTYQEGMISSKDGHCRAFDEQASGTINGEGCGVVVLKLLKKAEQDKDNIHAIIKGSAINNDGQIKVGYTAPSVSGQTSAIRSALHFSKVRPESVSYIETHGTGTKLGDPIEIKALSKAYNSEKKNFCGIGSVKTNIGHLDTAAGIAGLIKLSLCLKNKKLVPSLHFKKPNPEIKFENSPFYVNSVLKEWLAEDMPLRGAVSSFGIGGTNAHMILEEPPLKEISESTGETRLINLSAKTKKALEEMTTNLAEFLDENRTMNFDDLALTLQIGRKDFYYKSTTTCSSISELIPLLHSKEKTKYFGSETGKKEIVFMFPGQGAQYVNMGLGLYRTNTFFASELDQCLEHINKINGGNDDISEILFNKKSKKEIHETKYTQPLIFSIEYSLAKLLINYGIQPNMMVGHSIGEYVAACLSGVFKLEDALKLVILRGQLMQSLPSGIMLSVDVRESDIIPMLKNSKVDIAVINTTDNCVISGRKEEIEELNKIFITKGYQTKQLNTSHAFHSGMMDPILDDFKKVLESIPRNTPEIPFVSNISGKWITNKQAMSADYWSDHLRKTVRFNDSIDKLLERDKVIFIEVGPGRSLSSFLKSNKNKTENHRVINLMRHKKEKIADEDYLKDKIGELWLYGLKIDWQKQNWIQGRHKISLPTYPFQRKRFWIDIDPYEMLSNQSSNRRLSIKEWFNYPSWKREILNGNTIEGKMKWLVFTNEDKVSNKIENLPVLKGHPLIKVFKAEKFSIVKSDTYFVNPFEKKHWERLFKEVNEGTDNSVGILYLWSLESPEENNICPKNGYNDYYTILNLCKSVNALEAKEQIPFVLLTNNVFQVLGSENEDLERYILTSSIKVIQQEFPRLYCKLIDLNIDAIGMDNLIYPDIIGKEIFTISNERVVALRNGMRWTVHLEKLAISEGENNSYLVDNGVYLITGGTGQVGMTHAKYLIASCRATVIICGRKKLPPQKTWEDTINKKGKYWKLIQELLSLEESGGKLIYYTVDVTDETEVASFIDELYSKYGKLNGIIHAAGVSNDKTAEKPISMAVKEDCIAQLSPKIQGLICLNRATEDRQLDFIIVTSSLASILGGIGFYAYSGANAMLDAYVESRAFAGGTTKWLSVNWDGWSENTGDFLITQKEGLKALDYVFTKNSVNQIIISLTELQVRIDKWVNMDLSQDNDLNDEVIEKIDDRPELITPYVPAVTTAQKQLVKLWSSQLGYHQIGIQDSFFELGGDSLKMIHLISKIQQQFSVDVPIDIFYQNPTIKAIISYMDQGKVSHYYPIPRAEKKEFYSLSSAQRKQFIIQEMNQDSTGYNETQVFQVKGNIDIDEIELGINKIIKRHEVLRTSIFLLDKEPVQKIWSVDKIKLITKSIELKDLKSNIDKSIRPFDLQKPPFLRVYMFKIKDREKLTVMVIDMHHLVTDEFSFANFVNELQTIYADKVFQQLPIQYKDYAEWQNSSKQREIQQDRRKYWLQLLGDKLPILTLPYDYTRPKFKTFGGRRITMEIEGKMTEMLNELCAESKCTLYMLTLAIYGVLLSKLSGDEDIIIGTPTSGRNKIETEMLIGMFVNTLALRILPKREIGFDEFLANVKEVVLHSFENQDYPFEKLVEDLSITKDPSRSPLFDVWFVLQNVEESDVNFKGLELQGYEYDFTSSKWDFTFQVNDNKNHLTYMVEYNEALFTKSTAEKFLEYIFEITRQILDNSRIRIGDISLVESKEISNTNADILNELDDIRF
ncbi:SDR family NAD(P)-dependent oxidoreductase [Dokdonia sp.]|uniref:SDR family NAD(P)-dependent oxidoreductase n=1 Tax=Dokdonia sp. TaxID=2024995 RepID=UPI003263C843